MAGHWKVDAIINDSIVVSYTVDSLGEKADIGMLENEGGDLVRKKNKDTVVQSKDIEVIYSE